MKLCVCVLIVATPIAVVTSNENEPKSVCRDYPRTEHFPSGTSCNGDNLPTYQDLVSANITMSTADFLEQHCCAFGGGDRISHDNLVFEQLRKFTGMPVSDFEDQHAPSQKALFWLVNEDSYPNLEDYLHIGQRFALSSIYFGLNGDTDWLECSDRENTNCSVPNNKSAWMSGVQECEWAYLSCDRNLFVTEIIMPSNVAIAGKNVPIISSDIGLLGESLEKVNLRNNRIGGTIPNSIGSLNLLTSFDGSYNNLQGRLPGILFTNATGFEVLRVGHNSLTGTIPDLSLSQLRELNLSFNNFTGNVANVLADVPKLSTFPSDVCNRIIFDPSSTVRLECPLKCYSGSPTLSYASNDGGGVASDLCSDYDGWIDRYGYGCDWYEARDAPGCPHHGHRYPNEDGIDANEACCHCSVECFNTTNKSCTNDDEWTAIVHNETISCGWFEENDEPGCATTYFSFLLMDDVSDPRESCCYCSEYGCQDDYGWQDVRIYNGIYEDDYYDDGYNFGHGCYWYEEWDEPGCPKYGDTWPDEDGITAREACCHCRGYDPDSAPPACFDYDGWVNSWGRGCDGYEFNDAPGCPYYGDMWPNEDNITGNDACCYCGGGETMNIPSASPSHQYKPTVTPSAMPSYKPSHQYEPTITPSVTLTDKPSHQYEPTVIPSVTPVCYDYIGWGDSGGDGCDVYEYWDDPGCPIWGYMYPNDDGTLPNDACCYCGGGFDLYNDDYVNDQCDFYDAHWQNIASTKYLPGSHQSCGELQYYISILNNQTYEDVTQFYCNELHNGTIFMKDACCICNPNQNNDPILNDDVNDDDDSSCVNHDIQIPKPWPRRNCEWFDRDVSRCEEFGTSTILIEGDSNVTARYANDVCCVCGGGKRECLEFNDNWMDSHPDESFNCSQYDSEERCAADGSGFISLGHNANTQCCVCGGGYSFKNDNVILNATNQTCLDETDWQSNNFTCSSFVDEFGAPDVEQCLAIGHITSIHGVNASEGCCDCWYGYDADTGGGYQGMLLGKMLRIGMMNYTDLEYVHNVTSSGDVEENSTLYEFVRKASDSYGFGLVLYDMNKLRKTHGLNRISNDTYSGCLDALSMSLLDMCIGPYKNSTFPPGTKSIKGLYTEEYILVVRGYRLGLRQYILLPFAPFHYKTWLLVTLTLLLLTSVHRWFVLGLLQSRASESPNDSQEEVLPKLVSIAKFQYFLKKGISVFFYFFTTFSSGVVETEIEDNDSTPASNIYVEKLIVVALSVFLFFTFILYGGSIAAIFVNNPQGPEFQTIHDIFATESNKICFHDSLYGIMERKYPTYIDNFHQSIVNDSQRLVYLQNNNECDSIVISRYSLSFISTQIDSSCDNLYPLYDENLFTQDVIIAISQTLGELGDELVNVMDIMASKNLYRERHDNIVSSFGEGWEYKDLKDMNGVVWESFIFPLMFSVALAGIALIVGCMKYKNRRESVHSESNPPKYIAESEEELAFLLDNDDDLHKFSNEVKRLNKESEGRMMEQIIQIVKSDILKQITDDIRGVTKRITDDNEAVINRITDDNESVIKRITDDNDGVIKRITDDNKGVMKRITDMESAMKRITDDNESVMKLVTECIESNS